MQLSSEELQQGRLNQPNLEIATRALLDQGYVVLEGVLPETWTAEMRQVIKQALSTKYESVEDVTGPRRGHGGIQPSIRAPFTDPLIIENPVIFQLLERVFGERFFGCLPYGCNTAFPGSEAQNVHRDCGHVFPELQIALPPVLIVANIALDDFTADNGATEIWPGSHHALGDSASEIGYLKIDEARQANYPSVRTGMPAGSIVLRDMRTWHRGMPNRTDASRTMLSLVYYRQYFVPDDYRTVLQGVSDEEWNSFSERVRQVYRLSRSG